MHEEPPSDPLLTYPWRQLVDQLRDPRSADAATALLVRTYGKRLTRAARRILGHREASRDAVQAALLELVEDLRADRLPSDVTAPGTWLVRRVERAARAMKHAALRRRVAEAEFASRYNWGGFPCGGNPEAMLAARDEAERRSIERALPHLPAAQRAVIDLFLDGLTTRELCRRLRITTDTMYRRTCDARATLRRILGAPQAVMAG